MLGGDSYRGVYVPPLMAEVMKEMQAEERAAAAAKPKVEADAYSGPKSAPERLPLSAETTARLEAVAKAPTLDDAFKALMKMPELKAKVAAEGLAEVAIYRVEDRDQRARSVATRYFGSDLTLYAGVLGNKMAIATRLDKLFGYSDMRSNRFGIQYERSEERLRTGIWAHLPSSVGTKELARWVPELTPQSLSQKIADYLSSPA